MGAGSPFVMKLFYTISIEIVTLEKLLGSAPKRGKMPPKIFDPKNVEKSIRTPKFFQPFSSNQPRFRPM